MIMSKSTTTLAAYRIYAVERRRSRLASWKDIGLAFSHRDGKGFDLELQSVPLSAAELVVRTASERILPNGAVAEARKRGSRTVERRCKDADTRPSA
jgi:hypothetical protein